MVDLTGRYYTLEDCAAPFVEHCVDTERYARHAGDYVKNAYDPRFTVEGKYDEEAAAKAEDLNIVICMEMKQEGTAFKIEKHVHNYPHCWRTDKPCALLSARQLVHPLHRSQRAHDCAERNDSLETRIDGDGTFRQMARKSQRLEPQPLALLGHTASDLAQQ